MCGDYWWLNSITVANRYPILHIHGIKNVFYKKSVISKVDIVNAYYHIQINEKDILKMCALTAIGSFYVSIMG